MSYNKFAWGLGACAALFLCAWYFLGDDANTSTISETKKPEQNQNAAITRLHNQMALEDNSKSTSPIDLNTIPSSPEVSDQIEIAIKSYAEISKYPPNSQPILSDTHVNSFINASTPESSLPYPFDDLETPIQLSIKIDKYNYFFGDTVNASVSVSDIPDNATVSGRSVLILSLIHI